MAKMEDKLDELLTNLLYLKVMEQEGGGDIEDLHKQADALLIEYINDPQVTALWNAMTRWYS